jgi:hypothetical protein
VSGISAAAFGNDVAHVAWREGIEAPDAPDAHGVDGLAKAEAHYREAVERCPEDPVAHNNLGCAQQLRGEGAEALAGFRRALQLDPQLRTARRNLATLLARLGREEESLEVFHEELVADEEGCRWMEELVSAAMRHGAFEIAGRYAAIHAKLRWGSRWCPRAANGSPPAIPVRPSDRYLTVPKLHHDIEQFEYLLRQRVLGEEFRATIEQYRAIADVLASRGGDARVPFDPHEHEAIGDVYNRIVHIRPTPRVERALSSAWDPATVEARYLDRPLGLVVVDDFLCEEALEEVRLFCLESTVWSANRYGHGRLGAFFHDGFNCPLLLQIAEELREALPRVIVDRYPLRQVWGFKNGQYLPEGSTTHADFAAVNVNFWITPDEANLDPESGGLVVYDVDAPMSWDFSTYNGRSDIIKSFLYQQGAQPVHIPYRQNRAIIFNSDLFHASAGLRFRAGYENRRINVTMLYGDRQSDEHHGNLAQQDLMGATNGGPPPWRSAAFTRPRRAAGRR